MTVYAHQNQSLDKSKRRRSLKFSKTWIGRNANVKTLERYCLEIWSDLVRARDTYKCFMCGSGEYLNAHHLITKKWLKTAFDVNCGVTLCKNCHDSNIYSAHMSPWILEKKVREQRPDQYRWYLINRASVPESELQVSQQKDYDYHLCLKKLLAEFEEKFPSTIQRSNYFKFSKGEEEQIVHEFLNLEAPTKMIARKWGCSNSCINDILKRHGVSLTSSKTKKRNKEMLQKICGHCVVKLDNNKNVLAEYVSMNEAARQHGMAINSIRNCIKGLSKTAGGFKWAYAKGFITRMARKNNITKENVTI